jgi:hypothetical protein
MNRIKDYAEEVFTEEEIRLIVNRWQFWKGLAIGVILTVGGLAIVGLFVNY